MAKQNSVDDDLALGGGDNDFPPSYSEATTPSTSTAAAPHTTNHNSNHSPEPPLLRVFASPIASHLETLPARMRAAQQAHVNDQAARDLDAIGQLVPDLEAFLRDVAAASARDRGPPPLAELTLVPAAAVPRGWALSGAAERRREGEVVRVVRVADPLSPSSTGASAASAFSSDSKRDTYATPGVATEKGWTSGTSSYGGGSSNNARQDRSDDDYDDDDGYNRSTASRNAGSTSAVASFFHDERVARRLAAYLQPRPEVKVERRAVQQAVVDAKKERASSSGWRWGRKKSESASTPQPSPPPQLSSSPALGPIPVVAVDAEDRVTMTVRADEVTFRKENDFGVWESLSGFGIVVTVRVKKP